MSQHDHDMDIQIEVDMIWAWLFNKVSQNNRLLDIILQMSSSSHIGIYYWTYQRNDQSSSLWQYQNCLISYGEFISYLWSFFFFSLDQTQEWFIAFIYFHVCSLLYFMISNLFSFFILTGRMKRRINLYFT
jgi:hypothetical protein